MAKEVLVTDEALLTGWHFNDKIREVRLDPSVGPDRWVPPSGRIIPANANKPKK